MGNPETAAEAAFFSKQVKTANRFYRSLPDYAKNSNSAPAGKSNKAGKLLAETALAAEERICVTAGGHETCTPGYRIHRKDFQYYGIEYVASGTGTLILQDKEYPLLPGTVFCYGPGIEHTIINNSSEDMVKHFIDIHGDRGRQLLEEVELLGKAVHTSSPSAITAAYDELVLFGLSQSPLSAPLCSSLVTSLIYKIAHTALPNGEPYTVSFATYTRCRNIISEQYMELSSLEDIAQACGAAPSYLCRLFKKYDHKSPYQFLLRLQMNYAADLLMSQGLQVKETALRLNYQDQFHFSRVFKRTMGRSPRSFTNKHAVRQRKT